MNAIVLAGGFGSRLMPLTAKTPKPMLEVANYPMLGYAAAQLSHFGIGDVVYTLGYMPDRIRAYADGFSGLSARYSVEERPLGTAGGVKAAEAMLDKRFYVVSGDALSDVDLGAMAAAHKRRGAAVTMALTTVKNPTLYGVAAIDGDDRVVGFVEKPSDGRYGNLVNTGIYLIEREALDRIPRDTMFDFSRDLFPRLVADGLLYAYLHDGYWSDIGDKNSYFAANHFMKEGGFYARAANAWDGRFGSSLKAGSLVSDRAVTVGRFADCVIGADCVIASSADISECVVTAGATVKGRFARCIIGRDYVVPIDAAPPIQNPRSRPALDLSPLDTV
jgi:mannose-1-phosphate guanylyltransferase/phosphomannomutase